MLEIKVYETAEEARQQLEEYERDNREAFEGFVKRQGESASERLGKQTYFFVAELAAYVDNNEPLFSFESEAFPFLGHNGFYNEISSLVRGVKDVVRQQTPRNIEVIMYTTEEKNYIEGLTEQEEQEIYEWSLQEAHEAHLSRLESLTNEQIDKLDDEMYSIAAKIDMNELARFNRMENKRPEMKRGLTKQEIDEFVRLYSEK